VEAHGELEKWNHSFLVSELERFGSLSNLNTYHRH